MKNSILIIVSIILSQYGIHAQEAKKVWELTSPESGTKNYVARDQIVLKPGFSYAATGGNSFSARIDQALLFPPTEGTYALPDGEFTADPTQGAVVGCIPRQFAVSPTGAATYMVPIEVPAGINGMQPNISLVYNSQSGSGIAGWGWNISGMSAITKGAKTIFSDEAVSGINLSVNSDYYLDGNKLFAKTGFTYGATNAEYETENRTYVKIKQTASANGCPSIFTVTDKNGTVMEYGQVVKLKNCAYPFQWLLSSVTDANGNIVKYTYKTNANGTQTVLDAIEYGNNGNTAAPFKVVFNYTEKSYIQKQWIGGYYFEDCYLLQNITIKSNPVQLRDYRFTYNYRDKKYFMSEIKLTNENSESLPATTIEWGEKNNVIVVKDKPSSLTSSSAQGGKIAFLSDDITGDGISDLIEMRADGNNTIVCVYKADGTGGCGFTQYGIGHSFPVSLGASYMIQEAGNYMVLRHYNKKWISMSVSNSHNTFFRLYDPSNTNPNMNTRSIIVANSQKTIIHTIADFNNDGNDEIFYVDKTNNTYYGKMLYLKKNLPDVVSKDIFSRSSDTPEHVFSGDFNADGLIDVAIVGKSGIYIYKNNGGVKQSDGFVHSGFSLANTFSFDMSDGQHMIKPGDFNGDGLMDFVSYDGNNNFNLLISNGNFGFATHSLSNVTMYEDTSTGENDNKDDFIVTDYNHDGKSDLIVVDAVYNGKNYSTTYIRWFASDGTSFTQTASHTVSNEQYYYKGYATTGDFNGDGKDDVFCYNANLAGTNYNMADKYKIHTTFSAANADAADFSEDKVRKITDGMKNRTEITYQPLSVYKASEGEDYFYKKNEYFFSEYPKTTVQIPLYCVSHVNEGNDTFSTNTGYCYEYARVHLQGKGFLGFGAIIKKDLTYNLTESHFVTIHDSLYLPCASSIMSMATMTTKDFTVKKSGKIITSLPSRTEEYNYLAGLSEITDYLSYDDFGNLTKQRVTKGGVVQNSSITYIQRGAWCANKPGSVTTITSYQNQNDTLIKTFDYDNKGNLTEEIVRPNKPLFKVTTAYTDFDVFGHARTISVKAKDANGAEQTRVTSCAYTPSGLFVQRKTNVLGEATYYDWNETRGIPNSETNHYGQKTEYAYDNWGRLKETLRPGGNRQTTVTRWAQAGNSIGAKYYNYSQTSGNSPVVTWYDGLGREVQRDTWGLNDKKICVRTEYYDTGKNREGRPFRVSNPYFENEENISWAVTYDNYDPYGRNTYRTTPMGQDTIVYDGWTTTIITPEGKRVTIINSSGFTESNTVNGKKVSYTYYPNGQVKTATPEGGSALSMGYDLRGNRTKLTDPDAGVVESRYNGFGELVEEKQKIHDSNYLTTLYHYAPATGLLNALVRNGETKTYTYDTEAGYPGRIRSIEIAGQHKQTVSYDNLGRVTDLREEIDGKTIDKGITYDALGRVKRETYPSGYYTEKHYDNNGYLTRVTDRAGRQIWQVLAGNSRGQIIEEKKGNVVTTYEYDNHGFPTFTYAQGIVDILDEFDTKGNLVYRDNYAVPNSPMEYIGYDNLNRLKSWEVDSRIDSVIYSNAGNIQSKSDLGGYTMNYGENGKPHSLTSVAGVPTGFPASDLSITYTDFKKIKTLSEGNKTYDVVYGIDQQRRKSLYKENNAIKETRYYFGDYEEKTDHTSGITEKIHYLGNAIYIEKSNGLNDFYYTYTDYQGSLVALVREDGSVAERYAFDPWGKRRNPSNWTQTDSRTSWLVNRGYTMHEHLDAFGLINMNGRVYDPLTAQFFSPDPYIQAPDNWLNYNRYSYCLNNPFKYTDPDGENPILIAAIIIGAAAGGYTGYKIADANGYDIGDWQTWGYMLGGAAIGGVSGYAGATIATGGGFMANTLGIMYSSHVSSVGMTILSEGDLTPSINFGLASYDFGTGEWGYLGKEDNKWYQDLGYGLGALANLSDVVSLFGGGTNIDLIAEKKDAVSHSALVNKSEGINISVGPYREMGEGINMEALKSGVGTFKELSRTMKGKIWENHATDGHGWKISINNVNKKILTKLSSNLQTKMDNQTLMWNLLGKSCVSYTSKALWSVGVPNLGGIHPYWLQLQMITRQVGIYSSPYLYQIP